MFQKILILFRYHEMKLYFKYNNTHSWFIFLLGYFNIAFFLWVDIFLAMIFVNGYQKSLIAVITLIAMLIIGCTLRTAWTWSRGTTKMAGLQDNFNSQARPILDKGKTSGLYMLKLAGFAWITLSASGLVVFSIYSVLGGLSLKAFLGMNLYYCGKWFVLIISTLAVYYFQNISTLTKSLVKPMFLFIASLCFLLIVNTLLNWPLPMLFGLSLFFSLFFTRDLLYTLTKDEHHEIILGFSLFLMSLFWLAMLLVRSGLLSLGSAFLVSIDALKNLTPLLDLIHQVLLPLKALSTQWFFPLIELLFFAVLIFTGRILLEGVFWLRKKLIGHNPHDERYFLSLYPLVFNLSGAVLIYSFLFMVLPLIAGFFSWLFTVFKLPEIFNLQFLTKNNLLGFFYFVLGLFLLSRIFEILNLGIRAFKGYVSINAQELVYSEPGLIKKKLYRIPLKQIKLVYIEQAHFQKYFCYGSLMVHSADDFAPLMIHHLPYPENIQNKIMMMVHHDDK